MKRKELIVKIVHQNDGILNFLMTVARTLESTPTSPQDPFSLSLASLELHWNFLEARV